MADPHRFADLLARWRSGDQAAANEIMDTAYGELHRVAEHYMRGERAGHTLQATALVNELYVRLFAGAPVQWQNRAHFFAVAARQLRRILINYAREREAAKRGGGRLRISLTEVNGVVQPRDEDLLALEEALKRLEQLDPRAAQVVELRFFGGLEEKEAAEVIGISVATLKRDWDFARVWLLGELSAAEPQ